MTLVYIDTNIYMDHFDNRTDGLRPLGEFAFELLRRVRNGDFIVIFSTLVSEELSYNTYEERIKQLLEDLNENVIYTGILQDDAKLANRICKDRGTTFNDTLHAIISKRMNAEYFITRNFKDFEILQDFVKLKYPENL